ncbi:MAG: hypothetical protein ACRDWS_11855 [Acidimicrobiia bacterium]
MATSPDVVVEIPPPETAPVEERRWGLALMFLAMIIGLSVFVTVTQPRLPPIEWERRTGPDGSINLDSLVATAERFALLSGMTVDGVLLWSSNEGQAWQSTPLRDAPSQLAPIGDGLIAYGVKTGRMVTIEDDAWVEDGESIVFPDEVRSRQASGRPSVVGAEDGFLAMSLSGDVWWSTEAGQFEKVLADPSWGPGQAVEVPFDSECRPPTRTSPDVPPMVETDSGLVAMISSNPAEPFGIWPVCEPKVWSSGDGRSWSGSDTTLENGAYVYNLAWREGRLTAVGGFGVGAPAVWTSTDGQTWEPIDSFTALAGIDLYTIEAGPAGWVILGRDREGSGTVGWTSTDGLCWTALPWYVNGGEAAVTSEHIVVLDRTAYPEIWVGTATGESGSCP